MGQIHVLSVKICLRLTLFSIIIIIIKINNDYTWYNTCSAWFLDVSKSICSLLLTVWTHVCELLL